MELNRTIFPNQAILTDHLESELLDFSYWKNFGDRTSSWVTTSPRFSKYPIPNFSDGIICFSSAKNTIAIAGEPLCSPNNRGDAVLDFFASKKDLNQKKNKLIFPIGKRLAGELKNKGYSTFQGGIEPIFNLEEYFSRPIDPLDLFPSAMRLKNKNYTVGEIQVSYLHSRSHEVNSLIHQWTSTRKLPALGFLSRSALFQCSEFKRYWRVETPEGNLIAVAGLLPIASDHKIFGYYCSDLIYSSQAKSQTTQLLLIECMRGLFDEGILEFRLGIAPLAHQILNKNQIPEDPVRSPFLENLFFKLACSHPSAKSYIFGLEKFKSALEPSRWEPTYVAYAPSTSLFGVIWGLWEIHSLPKLSIVRFFKRSKITFCFFGVFWGLEISKILFPTFLRFAQQCAFSPGNITFKGLVLGPLFHANEYHFWGDQLSFLIFGAWSENLLKRSHFLLLMILGLWLSNPITVALVKPLLLSLFPMHLSAFDSEIDIGSSNAIYALVGGLSAIIPKGKFLFWPFAINGILLCFLKSSPLALHHLFSLIFGLMISWMFFETQSHYKKSGL